VYPDLYSSAMLHCPIIGLMQNVCGKHPRRNKIMQNPGRDL
jgi:hypothetical protein